MVVADVFENVLLKTHALAGVIALLAGIGAMISNPKGGRSHKLSGKAFYYAMLWIFISAFLLLVFFRFRLFMLVIAVFSFYMAFSGRRVLRRKKPGTEIELDRFGAYLAMGAGVLLLAYGMFKLVTIGAGIGSILSIIFGFMTFNVAYSDYRSMKLTYSNHSKMWWWYRHMSRMLGAYIAATTAFLVVNGSHWFGPQNWLWLLWLIPTIIGTPLISYWIGSYRRSFSEE